MQDQPGHSLQIDDMVMFMVIWQVTCSWLVFLHLTIVINQCKFHLQSKNLAKKRTEV